MDVAGAVPLLEHPDHRGVDAIGVRAQAQRVAEEHGRGKDGRDGIGDSLPRDIGRGAVHGLVEPHAAPDACRREHAHGAGQDGRLVGEDVAEGVLGDDGVEVRRLVDESHGAVVHEDVLEGHLRIVLAHAGDHLAPELRDHKDVGLVHGSQSLLPLHGDVEGGPGHSLHLARGVGHGVHGPGAAVGELLPAPRLAEVEPARQLPDDHDVGALDHLALQGGGVQQHGEALGRSQVGEEVELLAKAQESPLGLLLLRQSVPLGSPDRAEEDGVALLAQPEGGGGERLARGVDGRPSDESGLELEGGAGGPAHHLEHLAGFGRHLLPDAVAPEQRDLVRRHDRSPAGAARMVQMRSGDGSAARGVLSLSPRLVASPLSSKCHVR